MPEPEQPNEGQLILYQTGQGTVRVEVLFQDETFWLDQKNSVMKNREMRRM